MKFRLVRTSLWAVRVLLAAMVLFWAATLANITFAYAQGGSQRARGYLMHVGTPAKAYMPGRDEELRDTQMAYEILIFYILLTWLLRELHSYLGRAMVAKPSPFAGC